MGGAALLGEFEYDLSGARTVQTFPLAPPGRAGLAPTSLVTFEVVSNFGNPDYTCVYRFRLHGDPAE